MSDAASQRMGNLVRVAPRAGSTEQRPANAQVGQQFWDTTLGHAIWWNGEKWVNWIGEPVK